MVRGGKPITGCAKLTRGGAAGLLLLHLSRLRRAVAVRDADEQAGSQADALRVILAKVDGVGGLGVEAEAVARAGPEEEVADDLGVHGTGVAAVGAEVGVLGAEAGLHLHGGGERPGLLEQAVEVPLGGGVGEERDGARLKDQPVRDEGELDAGIGAKGGGAAREEPAGGGAEGERGGGLFLLFGVGGFGVWCLAAGLRLVAIVIDFATMVTLSGHTHGIRRSARYRLRVGRELGRGATGRRQSGANTSDSEAV